MRSSFLVVFFVAIACTRTLGSDLKTAPSTKMANGTVTVIWADDADHSRLLIHFHGAPETVKQAFARSELKAVLVVVNFSGLSSAYSKPFVEDRQLFDKIQEQARDVTTEASTKKHETWQHVTVSSFSAGYGAIREILKSPSHFDQIDAIVTADSIYAGLQREQPDRKVDESNMHDFLRFASLAADGKKSFILSHSSQPTSYASTTETADYLLQSLNIERLTDTSLSSDSLVQSSRAERGKFLVLGFEGTSGQEHMQHLRHIELLWKTLRTVEHHVP